MIYLVDALVYLIAWAFQGFTGFGAGIFIVGVLSLYHDPRDVVVSSTVVNLFGVSVILFMTLKRAKPDRFILATLIAGSVPGIFLGSEVLFGIDRTTLRLSIGLFIVVLGIYDLMVQGGPFSKISLRRSLPAGVFFGFLGGFFAGLVGMGGPPPVVYLNQTVRDPDTFRVTINAFFASNIALRTFFYIAEDGLRSFDPLMILPAPLVVPLGVLLGLVASSLIGRHTFKKVVSLSVLLIGLALVIREALW